VLGNNGSGKSTLLQIIAGYLSANEGSVEWMDNGEPIHRDFIYRKVAICSPTIQLWDELSLSENYNLFTRFKSLPSCANATDFAAAIELNHHLNKPLKSFSSGMRQRVKLGLAVLSDNQLLLLDEPCSHLDSKAVHWYQTLMEKNASGRTIFIASNSDERETFLSKNQIDINRYKD
jgi:ABC-2 type transport system ATP-binding protein